MNRQTQAELTRKLSGFREEVGELKNALHRHNSLHRHREIHLMVQRMMRLEGKMKDLVKQIAPPTVTAKSN